MTIVLGYTVTFDDRLSSADITSRTLGFSTSTRAGIGELGRMECSITLNNNDGAFTPTEGGGTGTYRNVDWYSQRLRIVANFTLGNHEVFSGIIRGIDVADDGVNSFVTLRALDWMQVATSEPFDLTASGSSIDPATAINNALDGAGNWGDGLTIQKFGDPSVPTNPAFLTLGTANFSVKRPALTDVTTKDVISTVLLPSGPFVHIPGGLSFQYGGTPFTNLLGFVISPTLDYTKPYVDVVPFDENGSQSPAKLPFNQVEVGFNTDDITNLTYAASAVSGLAGQTVSDTVSLDKYGSRPRRFTRTANDSEADLTNVAGFWTNRQSTVRYTPARLKFTVQTVEAKLVNSLDVQLLVRSVFDYSICLFQRVNVTYTPTGGTSVTAPAVIYSRRIDARPGNTTVTLDLLPGLDYSSFVLDSSTFGVLDQNRLG